MVAFITELNEENYNEFIKNGISLVDCYANWCTPCLAISPIIDELSIEYQGKISVGKIDVDQNKEIISDLSIRNIPALVLYKNGEPIDRLVGQVSKAKLVEMISKHIEE